MNRRNQILGWGAPLATLVAALVLAGCDSKDEAQLLASARALVQSSDHKAAVIQLKNVLQANPQSAEARFLLGKSLLAQGDANGAVVELQRAEELAYPVDKVAPVMARALVAKGESYRVIAQYGSLQPADTEAAVDLLVSVAQALAQQRQFEEARAALDRAQQLLPQAPEPQIAQVQLMIASEDLNGALRRSAELVERLPKQHEAWLLRADLLAQVQRDLDAAAAAYAKALALKADLPRAQAVLVALQLEKGDLDAAKRQFESMKKALPTHPETRLLEAQLAYSSGQYKQARELVQALIQSAPEGAPALHLAGITEMKLGTLPQAETYLTAALKAAPGFAPSRRMLAQLYLNTHRPTKALEALRPLLEAEPADATVLSAAAQAHLQNGDSKTAEQLFARVGKLKPADTKVRAALALARLSKGGGESAMAELQSIAAEDPGSAVDMAVISTRLQRNDADGALKAIDALAAKQPTSPVAAQLRGRVYLQRKDPAAARKAFEAALAKDAKYLPAVASLAAMDLVEKRPDAAVARYEAVLNADPKNAQAMLDLAELKKRTGASPQQVGEQIASAVAADPGDVAARKALINHHLGLRDIKAALAAAQAAVAAQPNDVELLDKLARVQLAAADRQQALSAFNKIVALRPDSPLGPLGLAELALANKDWPTADRHVKRALELAPQGLPAIRLGLTVALQRGRPQEALELVRRVQARWPDDSLGYVLEGEVEIHQQRWDAAAAAFRKAASKPNPAQAPGRLHQSLLKAGKPAEAAKFAESWQSGHPKDVLFTTYLADLAMNQGDLPLAEKRYGEVLKLQPDNAMALNNVAWLLTKQKRPGAVAYAERALKAVPNAPALMDTLAMALATENQLPKAIELQKQVVAKAPDAAPFRLNLAKLYLQSGDKPQARGELEKLAKLGKDFAGHDEVVQLLKAAGG